MTLDWTRQLLVRTRQFDGRDCNVMLGVINKVKKGTEGIVINPFVPFLPFFFRDSKREQDSLYALLGSRASVKFAYVESRASEDVGKDTDSIALAYSIRF
jgi:hypothetical protein